MEIPVRIVEDAPEVNQINEEKKTSKLPKWFIPFLAGIVAMGILSAGLYNGHYQKYERTIGLIEDQLADQERFNKNNAIIMRAIEDNKKVIESMSGRTLEMQKAVGEVLKPKSVTIK